MARTAQRLRCFAALLVAATIASRAAAQGQQPQPLRPATARLAHEFSDVVGVRELSDGRLLIGDRREFSIVVADFATGAVTPIGRRGSGPEEYGSVTAFMLLAGDSTLMPDPSSRRWILFDGPRIAGAIPAAAPVFLATHGSISGADTAGNIIARRSLIGNQPLDGPTPDSVLLVRASMRSGETDTLTKLLTRPAVMSSQPGARGGPPASITLRSTLLGAGEEVNLFPDGWLSIARVNPYRVDWRKPDGTWVRGTALPFTEIALDDREKQAYRNRQIAILGRDPVPADAIWATTVPPFQPGALFAMRDGRLLVARTPSADRPGNRYDIVDRAGRLAGQLLLPSSERIIGTGKSAVYVLAIDTDGLQRVRRHPPP